jgi:hypothetical protein
MWTGYGSCPSGNRAYIVPFRADTVIWWNGYVVSNNNSSPSPIGRNFYNSDMIKTIDDDGMVHYLAYTDMASTTSETLLVLSDHGLYAGDIVENETRSLSSRLGSEGTPTINSLLLYTPIAGQIAGDIINKYKGYSTNNAESGTTTTNIKITAHGLATGDYVKCNSRFFVIRKVVVVDADNLTVESVTGQTSGDSIVLQKFFGQQVAEDTVIPSTIYTDYVSLDISLKPSYKSVGEESMGVETNSIDVVSRGKNLFDSSVLGNYSTSATEYKIENGINVKGIAINKYNNIGIIVKLLKPNTAYYITRKFEIVSGTSGGLMSIRDGGYSNIKDIGNAVPQGNGTIFTTPSDGKIMIGLYSSAGVSEVGEVNFTDIQIGIGTVSAPYTPYTEDKRTLALTNSLRRVSDTVADVYKEGQVVRNVSDWVELDGDRGWNELLENKIAYKKFYGNFGSTLDVALLIKYNGIKLIHTDNIADGFKGTPTSMYLCISNMDTGMCDNLVTTSAERKAYFCGYKMAHSDGVSPYQVNETDYDADTWAEWGVKSSGVVVDSTGVEFVSDGNIFQNISIPTNIKVSTKYAILYNVVSSTLQKSLILGSSGYAISTSITKNIGNNKAIATSLATILTNKIIFSTYNTESSGNKIKIKDIRVFELPTGSQIETDFNTLTADQLALKYKFYGLNPKNWKSVVDGSGLTDVLPTSQAPNYTPYKMLYQKAIPTIEVLDTEGVTDYLPLASYENGSLIVDSGSVNGRTKYTVPLNFRAMGMDNNALANTIKDYVLHLDEFTTETFLGIADKELQMLALATLESEVPSDIVLKINELINIWK